MHITQIEGKAHRAVANATKFGLTQMVHRLLCCHLSGNKIERSKIKAFIINLKEQVPVRQQMWKSNCGPRFLA